jgi:hypothetical protein
MSVETWETNGAAGGIDQTKNRITSNPSVDELEKWYEENGDWTLAVLDTEARAEAGSDDVQMVPLHYPIELKQIRQEYNPDELRELADRMPVVIEGGLAKIKLVNPPTLNVFDDREKAVQYLQDMYDYHRGEIEPIDIDTLPSHDGKYFFIINGHRRTRALKMKASQLGVSHESMDASFTIKHNLSFAEAKQEQYIENTSVAINPVEDARAIELHYLWLRDKNEDYSTAALQKIFGYGPDKIRDALRFVTAPDVIQEFVGRGLTYTNVVDLVKLREAYAESTKLQIEYEYQRDRQLNARESEEDKQRRMEDYVTSLRGVSDVSEERMFDYFESQILNRLRGKSTADVGGKIRAQTKQVKGEYGYTNETLMIFDEQLERRTQRIKVRREMGGAAIEVLGYLDAQGDLSPEVLAALQRIVAKQETTPALSVVEDAPADAGLFEEIA